MSKSVRDVVDYISNQGHLRQLEICFSGINDMWKIGSGYRNYSSYRKMGDPAPSLDLEIALLPLCRLRNIGRVSIDLQLLFGYNDGTIALAKKCEKIMMSTQPFGTAADKSWMTDRPLQGRLDMISDLLEDDLDELSGYAASILCLERFTSWYASEALRESRNGTAVKALDQTIQQAAKLPPPDGPHYSKNEYRYQCLCLLNPAGSKLTALNKVDIGPNSCYTSEEFFEKFKICVNDSVGNRDTSEYAQMQLETIRRWVRMKEIKETGKQGLLLMLSRYCREAAEAEEGWNHKKWHDNWWMGIPPLSRCYGILQTLGIALKQTGENNKAFVQSPKRPRKIKPST
ncbi:hypothetical protein B0J14DRAFT_562873 [Halenospora varia]|nr:hypothetical protein B0J14DRAFT_562873 [Halenospora varia]